MFGLGSRGCFWHNLECHRGLQRSAIGDAYVEGLLG